MKQNLLRFVLSVFLFILTELESFGQTTYYWNFGVTAIDASPTSSGNAIANFNVSDFSIGNANTSLSSPINSFSSSTTSEYSGASGSFNIGNAVRSGGLNIETSSYFAFSIQNSSNQSYSFVDIDFGIRSTPSGASLYALRTGSSFETELVTGSIPTTSTWVYRNHDLFNLEISANSTHNFRLYVFSATGFTSINTRLDDVIITITPVPEPTMILTIGLAILFATRLIAKRYARQN